MRSKDAAIPPAPRKTLLQWIEDDDGEASLSAAPVCSAQAQSLHARLFLEPAEEKGATDWLQPAAGLRLPPLG